MSRLERDRAAALEASRVSQAKAKQLNALYDAAPDLLAALQRIVAVLDKQVASPHLAERASPLAQAKAAIAKATGEPQNYWCDEAGTATVEDGSIARLALSGQPVHFEDEWQSDIAAAAGGLTQTAIER